MLETARRIADSVTAEQEAEILRFAPSEDEVSTATLDTLLVGVRDDVRSAAFLHAGDVITLDGRLVVVVTVGSPFRDGDGVQRVVITGTGDHAATVAVPVKRSDLFVVA